MSCRGGSINTPVKDVDSEQDPITVAISSSLGNAGLFCKEIPSKVSLPLTNENHCGSGEFMIEESMESEISSGFLKVKKNEK